MSKDQKKNKGGRPVIGKPQNKRLPEVRISEEQLSTYKDAAQQSNKSFSEWVRSVLDKETKAR